MGSLVDNPETRKLPIPGKLPMALLVLSSIPILWSPFLGISLVFMLLYVWSREFPNAQINIYGLVQLKVCSVLFQLETTIVFLSFFISYINSQDLAESSKSHTHVISSMLSISQWAMLSLDVIFGSSLLPYLLGIIAGHLYYFLTVLHPLAGGKNILKTPMWVHKLVARWGVRAQPMNRGQWMDTAQPETSTGMAFRGRSYWLSD